MKLCWCFCRFNKEKLHSLVTERCYPVRLVLLHWKLSSSLKEFPTEYLSTHPLFNVQEMTRGNRYKTIRWRFIESLEPPRVVHARCPDMVAKGNLYGQVTVRMHSKQVGQLATRMSDGNRIL